MVDSRYRSTSAITRDGQTYLGLPARGVFALKGTDVFYEVEPEDTLHKIAYKAFHRADLWWVVADFNDIEDPFADIVPGTLLRLPSEARLWMEVLA